MAKKFLILSSDPTILKWKSLEVKKQHILDALNRTLNGTWEVEVQYRPLTPEVRDGRITHAWYNTISYPLFRQGYHHICLHFSMKQWEAFGMSNIRGANHVDTDFVSESYIRADETTIRGRVTNKMIQEAQEAQAREWFEQGAFDTYRAALKRARETVTRELYTQFVQTSLHEQSHDLCRACGIPDNTHAYHDASPDISGIFSQFDMNNWQPILREGLKVKVGLLQKIVSLLQRPVPTSLLHPVPQEYRKLITQPYGVRSTRYRITGRHIGTDYALPVGTALVAPADAEVLVAGTGTELGHFCHVRYTFQGEVWEERWTHLVRVPRTGRYARGTVVAYSGNTGMSTGPHLHREVHKGQVRIDLINKLNWSDLTVDPEGLPYSL